MSHFPIGGVFTTERTHARTIYRAPLVIKQDSEEGRKCNLRLVGQKAPGTGLKIHSAIFFYSASLILFVCPHTLGFNIHLHWRYLRGTGEHQLCPPICCGDRPEHLDPPKKQQQTKRQLVRVWLSVWRLCADLSCVYVCVCLWLYYEFGHSCPGLLIVRGSHSICSRR